MLAAKVLVALALLALASVPAQVLAAGEKLKELVARVQDVVEFRSDNLGMAPKDLKPMLADHSKLSEKERKDFETEPINKLTVDFAVKPVKFLHHQLTSSDTLGHENYMVRLVRVLRFFWPAYQGQILSRISFGKRLYKMKDMVKSLKAGEMPTVKSLLAVKREHQALMTRAQEIVDHEDIFSNIKEYAEILQGYNWVEHKLVLEELLPHVSPTMTPSELHKLVDEFKGKYGVLFGA